MVRIKKFLKDSLIVIIISVLLILIMEGFLRLFFSQNLSGKKIVGDHFSVEDELIGLKYVPGSKWKFSHPEYKVVYEINEHGFRDKKPHPIPKPEGTTRFLLLGDSFTFGQGVSYKKTWPVLVENWLEKNGNSHIDLVKSGLQGADTRSEYILMKRLIHSFDCDVVVIVFLINDLYSNSCKGIDDSECESLIDNNKGKDVLTENNNSFSEKLKRILIRNERGGNFHLLTFAKRLAISSESLYCKFYLKSVNKDYLAFPLEKTPKEKLKITEFLLKKIADYCHSLNKKLIVFSLPQQFQYLYVKNSKDVPNIDVHFYDNYFQNIAEQNDFIWIETLDDFSSTNNDKKLFYRLDGHLNPEGCKVAADIFIEDVFPVLK